jgi:hypothetical protein
VRIALVLALVALFAGCASDPEEPNVVVQVRNVGPHDLPYTVSFVRGDGGVASEKSFHAKARSFDSNAVVVPQGEYSVFAKFVGGSAQWSIRTGECPNRILLHTDAEGPPGSVMTSNTLKQCLDAS